MEDRLRILPIEQVPIPNKELGEQLITLDTEIKASGHRIWAAVSGELLAAIGEPNRLALVFMDLGTTNEIGSIVLDHTGKVTRREGVGEEFLREEDT